MKQKTVLINHRLIRLFLFAVVMLMPVSMLAQTTWYPIWIGGTQISSDNATGVTGDNLEGSITFDAGSNTLTLDNAIIRDSENVGGNIISELSKLTIVIKGYNEISTESYTAIRADGNGEQQLSIVKGGDECSLYLGSPFAIRGFSSLTITDLFWDGDYTYGLVHSEDGSDYYALLDAEGNEAGYAVLTDELAYPSMYPTEDDQGQPSFGFEGDPSWEIRYSIDYVDESLTDVTNALYDMNDPYVPMLGPCTVTAWRVQGNDKSKTVTGKLFNFAETWLEMMEGEVAGVPALVPAADPDDDLQIDYTDNDEQVANYIGDGLVEAVSAGTTTFYVSVRGGDLTPYTVLNGESMHFTVNVSSYGLRVSSENVTDVPVTKSNMDDVLADGGSVQFDGHNRLVLNSAQLTSIELSSAHTLPADGLVVYLEGESTIENSLSAAIISQASSYNPKLTFQTGSDAPGSLAYTCTSAELNGAISQGFDVTYKDHLALLNVGSTLMVKVPLGLIVDNIGTPATVTYTSSPGGSDTTPLDNDIIDKILYTLDDDGTAGSLDGYDGNEHAIVFNTTMTDEAVAAINTDEVIPGSAAYAAAFKGITFIVPAGKGEISLKLKSAPGYAFHVMVGYQTPVEVVNQDDYDDVVVPFACSEASYVKIYLVATAADARMAGIDDDHRAGPKATVSGGIGGMSVTSSLISMPPSASLHYKLMGADDFDVQGRHIVVNASDVTDLADNAFGFSASAAPARGTRRAAVSGHITYIDASNTMITGKHYSRQNGAFKDVPEETFIYLPAGNTAEGKNFIIGGICHEMQLRPDTEEDFEMAETFTASQVDFNHTFEQSADADEYHTVFLPYTLTTTTALGDFFGYEGYDSEKGEIKMKKLEPSSETSTTLTLDANKAYFFKPAAATALNPMLCVEIEPETAASNPADESEAEGLHGVYKQYRWTSKPSNVYGYTTVEKGGRNVATFAMVEGGMSVKPFQAYLRVNVPSAPESLSIDWGDGTTSIIPLDKDQVQQQADGWYTITGFRLPGKPVGKGIYIHNSQKTVVK